MMAKPEPRTSPCDAATRTGRLAKARQFMDAAATLDTLRENEDQHADALVTLYVHAGIAAADVLCCARLGKHPRGESHDDAVRLVAQVDKDASKFLNVLLGLKTKSGYSSLATSRDDRTRAERAARALMDKADAL